MNPSIDYDVTTCRYKRGSVEHIAAIYVDHLAAALADDLANNVSPYLLANDALRLGRWCADVGLFPNVSPDRSVDLWRGAQIVSRMAVHR